MTCEWESFNATCGDGEVLLIENADYGRMQLGRCVTRDYGYIGCRANVRDYIGEDGETVLRLHKFNTSHSSNQ